MIFKKIIMSIISAILFCASPLFMFGCDNVVAPPPPDSTELEDFGEHGKVTLAFPSISDIHFSSNLDSIVKEYYPKALKDANRLTNNRIHAVIVPGDFSEGYLKDYDTLMSLTAASVDSSVKLIASYGNHEGDNKHQQYIDKFGKPVDNITEVNGYNFITIGAHEGNTYTKSQAAFLDTNLEAMTKKDPNKPVFILVHHPVYDTNTADFGNKTFGDTLKKYPQAFVITGHDHAPFTADSLWQGEYTSFRNSYLKNEVQGQYALIRVTDKNKIIIQKYGISPKQETPVHLDGDFVIDFNKFLSDKK